MIVPLRSDAARDPARAGQKGARLAALAAAGFPVPDGAIVTTHALATVIASIDGDVGERLVDAPLPAALVDGIRALVMGAPGARWAVRSSAVAEDLATASFAGQYETVLAVVGTDEIVRALRRCWASFFAERARAYAARAGVTDARGAVVVQRLVDADAAGVAFTVDPVTGATDGVVVDASFGLGDAVVGGHLTPDHFVIDRDGVIVVRRLGDKRVRSVAAAGGSVLEPVDPARRGDASLDDDTARRVAALARDVEAHLGAPVDVEWAVSGGTVHLLQARPVTAVKSASARPVGADPGEPPDGWHPELDTAIDPRWPLYSSGNVGEVMPGCLTPLTWSYVGPALENGFRRLFESIGSMDPVARPQLVVGFFFHRLYLSVSYFLEAVDNSPGSDAHAVLRELAVGDEHLPPRASGWRFLAPRRFMRAARIISRFVAMEKEIPRDVARALTYVDTVERRSRTTDHDQVPLATLSAPSVEDYLVTEVHIRASQVANTAFDALRKQTRDWLADDGGALAVALVAGIGSLVSAEPSFGMHELAQVVRREPSLVALFADERDDRRLHARLLASTDPACARLAERLAAFLDAHGHRGVCEAEVSNPVWRDEPWQVLRHVRDRIDGAAPPPAEIVARQEQRAAEAREAALARLSPVRRSLLAQTIDRVRHAIAAREQMKDAVIRLTAINRRTVAAMQRQLLADGAIAAPADVFLLLRDEIARFAAGQLDRAAIGEIVALRRRDLAWARRVVAPMVQKDVPRCERVPAALATGEILRGSCASPGAVTGRARVVLDPREGAHLEPGEILVAPYTDLAWTPLFLHAAGLVIEVGGLLSHGSIVAREYGLPAVVGVVDATRAIRTGDTIALDASHGTVTRVTP